MSVADASASAPPEPPSPTTSVVIGTRAAATAANVALIAGPTAARSAGASFAAPGVSTSVRTGSPSRSARPMRRVAVR
ncbi:MAG: hypothetical protein QOF29_2384 [bacterium]